MPRGDKSSYASSRKGGRLGGRAAATRPAAARSHSAKKAGGYPQAAAPSTDAATRLQLLAGCNANLGPLAALALVAGAAQARLLLVSTLLPAGRLGSDLGDGCQGEENAHSGNCDKKCT